MSEVISIPDRVIVSVTPELVRKIDREWHKRRLPSRSATIRRLIEEALEKAKR